MARRRTGRQIAASRRNIKKAQRVSARNRRGGGKSRLSNAGVLKAGVAVGSVVGGAVIARQVYNRQFTYLYHTTNNHAAHKIVKEGFSEHKATVSGEGGRVFFQLKHKANKADRYAYGDGLVRVKIHKDHVNNRKIARFDESDYEIYGTYGVSIHAKHIRSLGLKPQRRRSRRTKAQIRARK